MADAFSHGVFLSYSSKDKAAVRDIAERLRAEGLRVRFDPSPLAGEGRERGTWKPTRCIER